MLLLGSLVAGAASAEPVELNPNAQFDLDVAGVVLGEAPTGGIVTWSPLELAGRSASGALRIVGPPGAYVLTRCVQVPTLPWAPYDYAMTVRLRSLGAPASAYGDVVLMWGGDDPPNDGPCRRPYAGFAADHAIAAPDADLVARIARATPVQDASQQLVLHKTDAADVIVDAWSLTIDADPLTADGFE